MRRLIRTIGIISMALTLVFGTALPALAGGLPPTPIVGGTPYTTLRIGEFYKGSDPALVAWRTANSDALGIKDGESITLTVTDGYNMNTVKLDKKAVKVKHLKGKFAPYTSFELGKDGQPASAIVYVPRGTKVRYAPPPPSFG